MTGSVLHIALVLPTYLPESFGGAEQQSRKLAMALVAQGHKVTLLAPKLKAATPAREQCDGMTIIRIPLLSAPNLGGRHFGSFLVWTLVTAFWLWHHRHQIDLIHIIHGRLHAVGPVLGACWSGKPSLIKFGRGGEHFDLDLVRGKRLFGPQFARFIIRNTTGYIANSAQMHGDARRNGIPEERIHDIPNGVLLPDLSGLATAGERPVTFIYMGRFETEKALDMMIAGFARLPSHIPARLLLVGEGPCQGDMEAQIAALGLGDRVQFTGRVDDVAPYLAQADFYLSTSLSEGMSNSLLEAMSWGVVPIVSRVSGVDDMIEDGRSGLLFAIGDLEAFSKKCLSALNLPRESYEALRHEARLTIEKRFGMDEIARRHIELYWQVYAMNAKQSANA